MDTKPTLEAVYDYLKKIDAEHREQFAALKTEVVSLRTEVIAVKDEIRLMNKTITVMGRDIYDLRTLLHSMDDRLDRLEVNPNAPTGKI